VFYYASLAGTEISSLNNKRLSFLCVHWQRLPFIPIVVRTSYL